MYKPLKGVVTPTADVPAEAEEAPDDPHVYEVGSHRCPHGFFVKAACPHCAPARPAQNLPLVVRDNRAAAKLLEPAANNEVKQDFVILDQLYEQITPFSSIKIGDLVVRKIRREQLGQVMHIEHLFTNSDLIRDIWVKWTGHESGTPYTPSELLLRKVQ